MIILYTQKRLYLCIISSAFFLTSTLAQVGIGTTSPVNGSILDITSSEKGILIPRIDIADLSTIDPIVGGAPVSLLVYNTNTTSGEGFYYWDGFDWTPLSNGSSGTGDDWTLSGNSGTVPGTGAGENYMGTSDAQDMLIATDDTERIRILSDGRVSINDATPFSTDLFTVSAATGDSAINGYSLGSGIGVYGQNTGSGFGVIGINSSTGIGVYGESTTGSGFSMFGLNGSIWGDYTTAGGDAIVGNTDTNGLSNGIWGINDNADGTAVLGGTDGIFVLPVGGTGVSGSTEKLGIYGYAGEGSRNNSNLGNAAARFNLDNDSDATTTTGNGADRAIAILAGFDNVSPDGSQAAADSYFGGYFSGGRQVGSQTFAYVGMRYGTNNGGTNGTDYKIIGTGAVSTLIEDGQGNHRVMFAPEAPEIVFQDFGIGTLTNGSAKITLDPILKKSLHVDREHPLRVYITVEGECNGVYVTDKSIDGFTVKELNNGKSNIAFSWQIVANRADRKDANGEVISKHIGHRLPLGPTYLEPIAKHAKRLNKPKVSTNMSKEHKFQK